MGLLDMNIRIISDDKIMSQKESNRMIRDYYKFCNPDDKKADFQKMKDYAVWALDLVRDISYMEDTYYELAVIFECDL